MTVSGTKKLFRQIALFFISLIIASTSLLLAIVVIMFLSSTLHMLNPDLFKFKNINFVTGGISVVILVISAVVFIKSFVKTYRYFKGMLTKDM